MSDTENDIFLWLILYTTKYSFIQIIMFTGNLESFNKK